MCVYVFLAFSSYFFPPFPFSLFLFFLPSFNFTACVYVYLSCGVKARFSVAVTPQNLTLWQMEGEDVWRKKKTVEVTRCREVDGRREGEWWQQAVFFFFFIFFLILFRCSPPIYIYMFLFTCDLVEGCFIAVTPLHISLSFLFFP
ncbi:hypothetical protein, unlikely [Trypanosoma brucei gambiense DAL972]|uniref:Uncharacterized protein n=1 Tax=Trypanosoma brucei gambiense (strain MHOM/CI/86/DAL972) TaxID=679716 RepID=C9ZKJ8_TRYB9|nr:hypothetical protein, unlikely [Trypanosoma brucei gambiense DAL972]CBH09964.1 hypothetical protein, unlikely [Trypanosoma brucei gambiense DAL972]|eukprot:XP_011772255.1 hypothetical protein, unlikely [Trypanosoma brucei gambiense DAL972]